jgi:type IV pilus assembly protein PilE
MERFNATNMSYRQTLAGVSVRPVPQPDCATSANTGQYYDYDVPDATLTVSTYVLTATPKSVQLKNDTQCGTLKLDQSGKHSVTGTSSSSVTDCWAH